MNQFYLFSSIFFALIIFYSCATEEEDTIVPTTLQTPEPAPEPSAVEFTLSVSASEGGTVSSEGGTYNEGTEVTVSATANSGYIFIGWEGNASTSESLNITLSSNQSIQALFELDSDGDGIIDSEDGWPLDPTLSENLWGVLNDLGTEFFFASDVADEIVEATRASFLEAIDEF